MSIGSDDDVRSSSTTSTVIIVSEVQTSKFVSFWLLILVGLASLARSDRGVLSPRRAGLELPIIFVVVRPCSSFHWYIVVALNDRLNFK